MPSSLSLQHNCDSAHIVGVLKKSDMGVVYKYCLVTVLSIISFLIEYDDVSGLQK